MFHKTHPLSPLSRKLPRSSLFPKAAQAEVMIPQTGNVPNNIEQRYRFRTATSITFCPVFFDDNSLPNIDVLVGQPNSAELTLDKLYCRERVMVHEYMHIPWVKNMNPDIDPSTYLEAAQTVAIQALGTTKSTPDCYAWYAVYSYFNNDHNGCGSDVWPPGVQKPVVVG